MKNYVRIIKGSFIFFYLTLLASCTTKELTIKESLQPVPKESGFRMDGYWVWGGSAIEVDGKYHLFASRWPKKNKFPDDYFVDSEIVRATADNPMGPYKFEEVVIGERDSTFWDANMAHNPTIYRIGNQFVLFYIGSDFNTMRPDGHRLIRRVGYATANSIEGPWTRSSQPAIDAESNNPSLLVENDGQVKLVYRTHDLKVKIAEAKNFAGPYEVVNENAWPQCKLEDFYFFKHDGQYHIICEDNVGEVSGHERWGVHLVSDDGVNDWKTYKDLVAYDHDIPLASSAEIIHCIRRERPQLLIQNGEITHLFNGILTESESYCQPVALSPPFGLITE